MLHILIVDDDPDVCDVYKQFIKKLNSKILYKIVKKPTQAIEILKKMKVSLLITDNVLDEMQGLDLVKKAKEIQKELKWHIVSGYILSELSSEQYTMKPITMLRFFEICKQVEN